MSVATMDGTVTVTASGHPAYEIPLGACWRVLLDLRSADTTGSYDTHGRLAAKAGVSRSSVSGFFRGRPTSLPVARGILFAIGLTFAEVATPIGPATAAQAAMG